MPKLIHIADDVHKKLLRIKGKESYSAVIRELIAETSNKARVLSFVGKGGVDEKKVKELGYIWKRWSEKYV